MLDQMMCVYKIIVLSYIQISTIYIPTYLIGKLSNKKLWRNLQALEVLRGPIGICLNQSSPGCSFLASCFAYSATPILICWCHCSQYLFPLGNCWCWVSWPSFWGSRLLLVLFIGWPPVSLNESPVPRVCSWVAAWCIRIWSFVGSCDVGNRAGSHSKQRRLVVVSQRIV